MPSVAGDGYKLITHTHAALVGPGMVHALRGRWTLGGVGDVLEEGESAHVLGTVGTFSNDEDPILVEVRTHQIVKVPSHSTSKPWGGEVSVEPWGLLKIITVAAGARTSLQSHREKDECLIAVEGSGRLNLPGREKSGGGGGVHIPPGIRHRVTGPLLLAEGSTYHPNDVVRHEDDYDRFQGVANL